VSADAFQHDAAQVPVFVFELARETALLLDEHYNAKVGRRWCMSTKAGRLALLDEDYIAQTGTESEWDHLGQEWTSGTTGQ
jgi:hypothetical protein